MLGASLASLGWRRARSALPIAGAVRWVTFGHVGQRGEGSIPVPLPPPDCAEIPGKSHIYCYFYPHIDPLRTAPYGGYSTTRGERLNDCSFWRWLRTVLRLGNFTSEIRCERCPASMTGEIIGRGCYRPGINEAHREASALRSKTSRAPCLTVQLFVVFRIIVSDS
jgi:hypothetical protein